jgi:glucan 1,3-beta-glucosidase
MTASAYLRHPASLLAAISLAIAFVWFALGYPIAMPPSPLAAGEKVPCVSYAPTPIPLRSDDEEIEIASARIEADLARLAPHTACVRTYMTGGGLHRVPEIARRHGLQVLQGIAIGSDPEANRREIARALELAQSQRSAIRAFIVGRRVLSRGDLSANELGVLIQNIRDSTKLPVTYAEDWARWLDADGLAKVVDFIMINVDLYTAEYPVGAGDVVRRALDARGKVAARFASRAILIDEIGWPSAGRMREGAYPSPANQARILHDILAAAKAANIQINVFEGIDQPQRQRSAETAAGHWGLIDADTGALKFRWGAAVSNHPLWFTQAMIGVLLAFVVFAAAYLAVRSTGTSGVAEIDWLPVAAIALGGGLFVGWAVAEMPVQNQSIADWAYAALLLALAFLMPPVTAASIVRRVPLEGFAAVLDPSWRHALKPFAKLVASLFVLVVTIAMQRALVIVFDSGSPDIPFAALNGPAIALLVLALQPASAIRHQGMAERVAASVLAAAAIFITFSETFWNWQALWFVAILLVLAWSCWRVRGAQTP